MSKISNSGGTPGSRTWKTRDEIEETVQAVLDPESVSGSLKQRVVISASRAMKAEFEEIAGTMKLDPGSMPHRILKVYCEEKKATTADARVLVHRMEGLSIEQLKVLELICLKGDFTARDILIFVEALKRIGISRILVLRAFIELDGVGPGPLHQFFMASLPQSSPAEVGKDAYEKEVREKMMTPDQVAVFYNICTRIPEITTKTAVALLPKIRQIKPQHGRMLNTFLRESVVFGDKPICNTNITGLINLWLSLPEIMDRPRFENFIKKLSRKPESKRKDFQFLAQSYKDEAEKGNGKSGNGTPGFFSSRA